MIQHIWTVLCTKSSIDRETNNISLFEVIEELQVEGLGREPGAVPCSFELVSLWSRSEPDTPSQGEARITFQSPGGRTSISQMQAVDLQHYRRLRSKVKILGIPVEEPGRYTFVVECRQQDQEQWIQVARMPLEVQAVLGAPQESHTEIQRTPDRPPPQ